MTGTCSGDIRGFYAELGVELPAWATREAPVRCFADPAAHQHGDRSPSCSVSLGSGAWKCHGCGAAGGAYDAAIALGHTPRSAIDLMIAHGLVEPRAQRAAAPQAQPARLATASRAANARVPPPGLAVTDADVQRWREVLGGDGRLILRLLRERSWSYRVIRELELGFDGERVTIPIRAGTGELCGVLRYDPFGERSPKMLAVPGTSLGLLPHPAREPASDVLLVEGPPDMIAARSSGLAAIAVPGTNAWQPSWAALLARRRVTIVMDCDEPGRRAARRIARSLERVAAVETADLWPERTDGYDLTDRILERRRLVARAPGIPKSIRVLLEPPPSPRWRSAARADPSTKEAA
jgi:hypothetical protein